MFSWRNNKNIMWMPPLIWSYDSCDITHIFLQLIHLRGIDTLSGGRQLSKLFASLLKRGLPYKERLCSLPASVAQLDVPSDWRPGGRWFNPRRGLQHSFMEIDHENIFCGHSVPSADSRRAVVSFWRKNVHNTG